MNQLAATLGPALRRARTRRQLRQADVAKRVNITTGYYGRIESGKALPSVPTLHQLVQVLDVSADQLLGLTLTDLMARTRDRHLYSFPRDSVQIRRITGLLANDTPRTVASVINVIDLLEKR